MSTYLDIWIVSVFGLLFQVGSNFQVMSNIVDSNKKTD